MNRSEKVNTIVEQFANMGYGESLTHKQIAEMIGIKSTDGSYRYIVHQAQKHLLGHGKMIECVRGVGYRVVQPDDYTTASARRIVAGVRQIDKGAKILSHAPTKDMTIEGIQAYNRVNDRVAILNAAVTGAKVEINMLATKREHPLAAVTK